MTAYLCFQIALGVLTIAGRGWALFTDPSRDGRGMKGFALAAEIAVLVWGLSLLFTPAVKG